MSKEIEEKIKNSKTKYIIKKNNYEKNSNR